MADLADLAQEMIEKTTIVPEKRTHGRCNKCHKVFSLEHLGTSGLCDECFYGG